MFNSAFMNGFARGIDIGASISYNSSKSLLSKSDSEALKGDWEVVGKDIKLAMKEYDNGKTAVSK